MSLIDKFIKSRKNWFAFGLTVFCAGLGVFLLGVSVVSTLRGSMNQQDFFIGCGIGLFCVLLGAIFSLFVMESHPREMLEHALAHASADLKTTIIGQGKTVKLAGFTLTSQGFTHRRFFRKVFTPYAAVAQIRSSYVELFVNGIRTNVSYQISLRVPREGSHERMKKITLGTQVSKRWHFPRALQALLFIENAVTDLIVPRELDRYRKGAKIDLGGIALAGAAIEHPKGVLAFADITACAINDYWISFGTKSASPKNTVSFKRKKIWNQPVLLAVLKEKSLPVQFVN